MPGPPGHIREQAGGGGFNPFSVLGGASGVPIPNLSTSSSATSSSSGGNLKSGPFTVSGGEGNTASATASGAGGLAGGSLVAVAVIAGLSWVAVKAIK